MAFEPVRIIHASHLRLDHQLEGLTHIPPEVHRIVEDATLAAFDYLLAACLDHRVDFLLLTGNTFDRHDNSLRAWAALEQGFELLDEHDIHVFVIPGEMDPASAWLNGPRWPDNVTVFYANDGGPVAAMRDEKPVATVRQLDEFGRDRDGLNLPRGKSSTGGPLRLAPFTIGVMPSGSTFLSSKFTQHKQGTTPSHDDRSQGQHADLTDSPEFADVNADDIDAEGSDDFHSPMQEFEASDYLAAQNSHEHDESAEHGKGSAGEVMDYIALGGPPQRQTFVTEDGLAHHPGTTQGISAHEQGPCGATLVELDHQGRGRSVFIPTGVVRWERLTIHVSPDATPTAAEIAVRESLSHISAISSEKICVLNWLLPGEGQLEQSLGDEEYVLQWLERIAAQSTKGHAVRYLHQVDWLSAESSSASTAAMEQPDSVPSLRQEFLQHLSELSRQGAESWLAAVRRLERELGRDEAARILSRQTCEGERIHRQARRLGRTWFHDLREEHDAA
ncbi:MAG: exonuclease SbcCD subunit D [Planctomycetaceae bacterium]